MIYLKSILYFFFFFLLLENLSSYNFKSNRIFNLNKLNLHQYKRVALKSTSHSSITTPSSSVPSHFSLSSTLNSKSFTTNSTKSTIYPSLSPSLSPSPSACSLIDFTYDRYMKLMDKVHSVYGELQPINSTVFCNVELNCGQLEAVGFDMDYTLAQYNEEFDRFTFECTKKKLVEKFGYPKEILELPYNGDLFRRGLVIDTKRGNVLLVDEHRYVRTAKHGEKFLESEERKEIYTKQVSSFAEKTYVNIDTVFLIVDAAIYMHLIEIRDHYDRQSSDSDSFFSNLSSHNIPFSSSVHSSPALSLKNSVWLQKKSYEELYKDVRDCVELVHRDGEMKEEVMKNPKKYIQYDPNLKKLLMELKESKKKIFLLTNSIWQYTDVVMNYLINGEKKKNSEKKISTNINEETCQTASTSNSTESLSWIDWRDFFDVIIVGANKPAFIREDYLNIFRVNNEGFLANIENRSTLKYNPSSIDGKVYQGGCWQDLHNLLGVESGQRILYIGDHLYADILRSKRSLGWRTCLVLPELERDLLISKQEESLIAHINQLRKWQVELDSILLSMNNSTLINNGNKKTSLLNLNMINKETELLKSALKASIDLLCSKFPGGWGPAWRAGPVPSRFAAQARSAACLLVPKASSPSISLAIKRGATFRPPGIGALLDLNESR